MGGRIGRVGRTWMAVLGVAVGASLLLPATPAAAHNSLTGSDPKDGARLAAAPKRIELRFLATPSPGTTKITITGPDSAPAGGTPTFSGNRISVPFTPGPAGVYTVAYRVGSTDGHPVSGEVSFTLTTGAVTTGTPSASAAPTTPAAPSTSPASPLPAAPRPDDDGGTGRWWAVGAVVLLLALAGAVLLRRRAARR